MMYETVIHDQKEVRAFLNKQDAEFYKAFLEDLICYYVIALYREKQLISYALTKSSKAFKSGFLNWISNFPLITEEDWTFCRTVYPLYVKGEIKEEIRPKNIAELPVEYQEILRESHGWLVYHHQLEAILSVKYGFDNKESSETRIRIGKKLCKNRLVVRFVDGLISDYGLWGSTICQNLSY